MIRLEYMRLKNLELSPIIEFLLSLIGMKHSREKNDFAKISTDLESDPKIILSDHQNNYVENL